MHVPTPTRTVMKSQLLVLAASTAALAGCASSHSAATQAGAPISPAVYVSATAPTPDPRVGLKSGWFNAGEAEWNLRLVTNTPPSADFINRNNPGDGRLTNSDLAFTGNYVIQGNYAGYQVWDISNPAHPTLHSAKICVGSQSDVSVYHNLLFESGEATNGRLDCGQEGVRDTVSKERFRGIRIWDASDIAHPRLITQVQTCRGSHTHTVVTSPNDPDNVYIYVSGSAPVRSPRELSGCSGLAPDQDSNSELFRIEVIQVPLAHPEQAHVVSKPAILADLGPAAKHAELPADVAAMEARMRAAGRTMRPNRPANMGPVQCHDITVYPAIGLAGGACGGYGLLLDIRDPANPKRLYAAADSNFSFWHSATFNNDGTKMLFTDEWGGGSNPRCRVTDKPEWGADAVFTLADDKLTFKSYYKLPAPQTSNENCVAHNGSLIPVPGRDIMVQAWYQGGVSVFDFTNPSHVKEIAYFDRGPMDSTKLVMAGSWSAYWYNGYIYSSEISRGLDVFALQPNPLLTENEIEAAKLVHFDELNVQDQPKLTWPAAFVVARAYVDQLEREGGLSEPQVTEARMHLAEAEKASGAQRNAHLNALISRLDADAQGSSEPQKIKLLTDEARALSR